MTKTLSEVAALRKIADAARWLVAADTAVQEVQDSLTDDDDNTAMAAKLREPVNERAKAMKALRVALTDADRVAKP